MSKVAGTLSFGMSLHEGCVAVMMVVMRVLGCTHVVHMFLVCVYTVSVIAVIVYTGIRCIYTVYICTWAVAGVSETDTSCFVGNWPI